MTRPYAEVIGDPIAHSKSPLIHNFWLKKLGIGAEYRACHVRADELKEYFTRRRGDAEWLGCNVTLPHKETAFALADARDAKATSLGATNCISHNLAGELAASNTDVDGVAEAIAPVALEGARVCVFGSGGAARAAFQRLAGRNCASVFVVARDLVKAERIASAFDMPASCFPMTQAGDALKDADLLINATQLGMVGQSAMPHDVIEGLRRMKGGGLVFDMVYAPLDTDLQQAAGKLGLRTADGLQMLVGQAATAFEMFFGEPAPRDHDAELRALLVA